MSRTEPTSSGLRRHGVDRLDQGQKLETHLPASERKGLDKDDIGPDPPQSAASSIVAPARACRRRRRVAGRSTSPEKPWSAAVIGGSATVQRRVRESPATGGPPVTMVNVEAVLRQRRCDPAGAGQMADAEQMLDVEEDARTRHS